MAAPQIVSHKSNNGINSWMWPTVIAIIVAIMQAFWAQAWTGVTSENQRLQREIDDLVSRREWNEHNNFVTAEVKRVDANAERGTAIGVRMREQLVSKDEYSGRHDSMVADIARLNGRFDEMRRDFGSSVTLSDKFKELQDQYKTLQERVYQLNDKTRTPVNSTH